MNRVSGSFYLPQAASSELSRTTGRTLKKCRMCGAIRCRSTCAVATASTSSWLAVPKKTPGPFVWWVWKYGRLAPIWCILDIYGFQFLLDDALQRDREEARPVVHSARELHAAGCVVCYSSRSIYLTRAATGNKLRFFVLQDFYHQTKGTRPLHLKLRYFHTRFGAWFARILQSDSARLVLRGSPGPSSWSMI